MSSTCSRRCAGAPRCSSRRTSWPTSNAYATPSRYSTGARSSPRRRSTTLKSRYGASKVLLEVADGADELAGALGEASWVSSVARGDAGEIELVVSDDAVAQREIPAMVAARGIGLRRLEAGEMGLEEVFVQLVGGESAMKDGFDSFVRKEATEIFRTWRIWVLPGIALFFALSGPALAKLDPADTADGGPGPGGRRDQDPGPDVLRLLRPVDQEPLPDRAVRDHHHLRRSRLLGAQERHGGARADEAGLAPRVRRRQGAGPRGVHRGHHGDRDADHVGADRRRLRRGAWRCAVAG